ncbi:MAG: WG repeat-containing protein [Chitinophagaceae bacterium]|nr:WG repeat-containing protein [Chitinophagaceae bacterium]
MKYIFFLIGLIFTLSGYSQSWTKQYDYVDECSCGLSLVGKGDKKGFVNKEGTLVIPLIYDEALTFAEGYAAVKKDGKWGYLDSTGKVFIEPLYTEAMSFYNGKAVVSKGNYYGYIDNEGKTVIPIIYESALKIF